jgi:hypothetical protein
MVDKYSCRDRTPSAFGRRSLGGYGILAAPFSVAVGYPS